MEKPALPPKSLIRALDELKDKLYEDFFYKVWYTEGLEGDFGLHLYRQVYKIKPGDFDRVIKYLNEHLELAENKKYYYTTLYVDTTDSKYNGSEDTVWSLVAVVRPYEKDKFELEVDLIAEPSRRRR